MKTTDFTVNDCQFTLIKIIEKFEIDETEYSMIYESSLEKLFLTLNKKID
jgi:hypothetical protein